MIMADYSDEYLHEYGPTQVAGLIMSSITDNSYIVYIYRERDRVDLYIYLDRIDPLEPRTTSNKIK